MSGQASEVWHDAIVLGDGRNNWQDWAARADFVPFEPIGNRIEAVWTGGFGGAPGYTGHLEVHALVGGRAVSVDTIGAQRHPDANVQRSMLIHNLIATHTLGQLSIELPYSLTVVSDDRQLSVSGQPVTFHGVRIDGTRPWIGEAPVDHLLIRVELPVPTTLDLQPCRDPASLSDAPPNPR